MIVATGSRRCGSIAPLAFYALNGELFTFDELRVPDEWAVMHVPRVRHFVCTNAEAGRYRLDRNGRAETEWRILFQPAFEAAIGKAET
jgi:hypothetical protein